MKAPMRPCYFDHRVYTEELGVETEWKGEFSETAFYPATHWDPASGGVELEGVYRRPVKGGEWTYVQWDDVPAYVLDMLRSDAQSQDDGL